MHTEYRIDIDASPDAVWRVLTEVELIKRWTPELISDEPVDDGPSRVGLVSNLQIKEGSRIVPYTMEITAYDRLDYLETVLTGGSLGAGPMRLGYRLEPSDGGTTVHFSSDWKPYGLFLRLMALLFWPMSRRHVKNSMTRLRDVAESL